MDRVQLDSFFRPAELKQGAGGNLRLLETASVDLSLRLGLGTRERLADGSLIYGGENPATDNAQAAFDATVNKVLDFNVSSNQTLEFHVADNQCDDNSGGVSLDLTRLPCVAAPVDLVSWWPGDGNATDIAGDNNGILTNGATFAAGKVGQAFSFDGVDDYVELGTPASLMPTNGEFTVDELIELIPASLMAGIPNVAPAEAT